MQTKPQSPNQLKTFLWCIKIAWEMNPFSLCCWIILSVVLAFLPAISLLLQKDILEQLTDFVTFGTGSFSLALNSIILLGVVLIFMEISKRFNIQFIFFSNYDFYQIGLSKRVMDLLQKIELKTLVDKEVKDSYESIRYKLEQLCAMLSTMFQLITQAVAIVSLLLVTVQYSYIITGVTVVYLLFCYFISKIFNYKLTYDFEKSRAYESRARYYEECVLDTGVAKELRVFHSAKKIVGEWKQEYQYISKENIRIARWGDSISFFCSVGYYVLILFLLIYSVYQVKNQLFTVSAFLILYEMARNMSDYILSFSNSCFHFKRVLKDMGHLKEFMEEVPLMAEREPQAMEGDNECPILIEARNVSFSYDDENEVLKDLNFQVKRGETVALVGLNGSGKSTLVKLLLGLYSPTGGELLFHGMPYETYSKEYISGNIGVFFQDYSVIHTTLRENVGIGDLEHMYDEERIMSAIQAGGAESLLENMPEGLETWLLRHVKWEGVNLSGGEEQRVVASRAHMSNRPILIFDEPASALDPIAEMNQFQAIQDKLKGQTGILISHRVGFAKMADRIIVLDQGKLIESGTHDELMLEKGAYANFYIKQAQWYQMDTEGVGETGEINEINF